MVLNLIVLVIFRLDDFCSLMFQVLSFYQARMIQPHRRHFVPRLPQAPDTKAYGIEIEENCQRTNKDEISYEVCVKATHINTLITWENVRSSIVLQLKAPGLRFFF
ncbi:hypothetical protein MARINOS108_10463 [Marinoscillum sp. 108]|nr:hypothetical protein MARINOS108_10463 [Marinoscillum sp. 108]